MKRAQLSRLNLADAVVDQKRALLGFISPPIKRSRTNDVQVLMEIDDTEEYIAGINMEAEKSIIVGTSRDSKPKRPPTYFDHLDKEIMKKIFGYLGLYELLQMYELDERYHEIIAKDIMSSRVLNISEIRKHYSVRHAFKYLGRFTPEVIIRQSDIQWKKAELSEVEEIIRLIGKRCSNEHLKKVTIIFDMEEKLPGKDHLEIPDSLKSIESLAIISYLHINQNFENYFKSLLSECKQLQSLTMSGLHKPGNYILLLNDIKLRELTVQSSMILWSEFWTQFAKKGIPSLKSFTYRPNINTPEQNIAQIAKAFPGVEHLDIIDCDYDYIWMARMVNLKSLDIRNCYLSANWTYNFLEALKRMDGLEELNIKFVNSRRHIFTTYASWCDAMKCLSSLRLIKIENPKETSLKWDIFIDMIKHLPNINEIYFTGNRVFTRKNIEDMVSISPKLSCVKLNTQVNNFNGNLYDKLVRERGRWYFKSPSIDIYFDTEKVNKLKGEITNYDEKSRWIGLHPLK